MIKCVIKPSRTDCNVCVETADMFDSVSDCENCTCKKRGYLFSINTGLSKGVFAVVIIEGELRTYPIDRIKNIEVED